MYCKVNNCRYADKHVTSFHQCGACHMFGHGRLECEHEGQRKNLEKFMNDTVDVTHRCTIADCVRKDTHRTEGHCCRYCGKKEVHMEQCPNNPTNSRNILTDPLSIAFDPRPATEQIKLIKGNYTHFYGGMGSSWFVRNNNGILEYCFMHSDAWGQYGEDTSDLPILNAFIEGYRYVNEEFPIQI